MMNKRSWQAWVLAVAGVGASFTMCVDACAQRLPESNGAKPAEKKESRKEEPRREATRERKESDRGSSREMRDNSSRSAPASRPNMERSSNDRRESRPERNFGGNDNKNSGAAANRGYPGFVPGSAPGFGQVPNGGAGLPGFGVPGMGGPDQSQLPTVKGKPNANDVSPNQLVRDAQDLKQLEMELNQKDREAEREERREAEEFEKQQKLEKQKVEALRKEAERLENINSQAASQRLSEAQQLERDIALKGARFLLEQQQRAQQRLRARDLALTQWRGNRDMAAAARAARPRNFAVPKPVNPRPEAAKHVALTPEQFAETLLDLASGDAEREIAALQRLGNAEAGEQRAKATAAILRHMNKNEPAKFAIAAKALAVWGDATVAPQLVKLIDSRDKETRHAAMRSLGFLKRADAAEKIAAKLVAPADRRAAAHALEDLGPASEAVVLPFLNHEDMWVRAEAALVLKEVGGVASRQALEDIAENDPEAFVRTRANEALRELGG